MKLTSGCKRLDQEIGPLREGMILAVFGPAGSGKTTMSIQYALMALAGGYRVLYVNTEDELFIDRLYEIRACRGLDVDLKRLHVAKVSTFKEQHKILTRTLMAVGRSYDLLIVDSLTGLFRLEVGEEPLDRVLKMLNMQLATIYSLVTGEGLAAIVTSQVRAEEGTANYVASAQQALEFWSTVMLRLDRGASLGSRVIEVIKPYFKGKREKPKILEARMTDEGLTC